MKNGKRRTDIKGNRYLQMEERLANKYRQAENVVQNPSSQGESGPGVVNGAQANGVNGASPGSSRTEGQSQRVVHAFACDDGAPIRLQYDDRAFRPTVGGVPARQTRSTLAAGQALPHHFEAFNGGSLSAPHPGQEAALQPPQPAGSPGNPALTQGPSAPQATIAPHLQPGNGTQSPSLQPGYGPQPPSLQPAAPDWGVLDQVAQENKPPENQDRFVSDLQALLSEARRRADAGQPQPALGATPAGQPAANPAATPQPTAPTASSPAAQGQVEGAIPASRHALFDQLGQQMQRAVTFDLGTVPVDKTFAAIEASIDAEAAREKAAQARAKRKPPAAKPLSPIEEVEDMALMTAPRGWRPPTVPHQIQMNRPSLDAAAMLSSDIPLDPGTGGRSIPVSTLMDGDIIVSTTKEAISALIRLGTQAPVSHAMLYIGGGQVVEAIETGVVMRPIEEALEKSYLAVALRHSALTPEQALQIRDYAGQQIGKPYNFLGIIRQAGFQLDKQVFCRGKTGEEYDRCIRWIGKINLGTASNDSFYCSELILKAFEMAGVPLTTNPPNYSSPGDLAELQGNGMLAYVGHLKYEP